MKNTWRSIWIMTLASLAVWIAAYVIVRIVPPAIAQAVEPPDDEEGPIGPPVKEHDELPADLRQSADNNVSFPVDI